MAKEIKPITVTKSIATNFVESGLIQLGVNELPDDNNDKKLVKNGLLAILDYAIRNGEKPTDYSPSSIYRSIETIKELKLNLALPNMAHIVVWRVKGNDGNYIHDVRVQPFKHGYREIFLNFGDDVKKLHAIWSIREGDHFVPPRWVGIKMTDAEYQQNVSFGKVLKVVLVYETLGGEIRYLISERNNVLPSLIGIVRKYGDKDTKVITNKIIDKIKELNDIDLALDYVIKNHPNYLSPAWLDHTERMIEVKMINYIVRNHPISDRKVTPEIKRALEHVLDMDYDDTKENVIALMDNDQKLDDDIENGVVGSEKIKVDGEPIEIKEEPIKEEVKEETKPEEVEHVVVDDEPIIETEETKTDIETQVEKSELAPFGLDEEPETKKDEPQSFEDLFSL